MRYFKFIFRYARVMVTNKLTVVGLNSPEKAFAESLTLYAKSSLKLTFLTPSTHMYVDVLGVGGERKTYNLGHNILEQYLS